MSHLPAELVERIAGSAAAKSGSDGKGIEIVYWFEWGSGMAVLPKNALIFDEGWEPEYVLGMIMLDVMVKRLGVWNALRKLKQGVKLSTAIFLID